MFLTNINQCSISSVGCCDQFHFSIFQKLHCFLIGVCHSVLIASGLEQIFINLINFQGDNDWKMLLDNIADL